MISSNIERVKVEPLGLDLRTLGYLIAHRDKHVAEALGDGGQGVTGTHIGSIPRQSYVNGLFDEHASISLGFELLLSLGKRLFEQTTSLTDALTSCASTARP